MHESRSFPVSRVPLFTLVTGISLTIGFLVPVAYELTEKPWNRSRLVPLERAAMVSVLLTCTLCPLAVWLGKGKPPAAEQKRKIQFRLWHLFAVMTLAALVLAAAKWLDLAWASALVAAVALGVAAWGLAQGGQVRSRTAALVASLFCPLVWMVAYNEPFGRTSGLVAAMPIAPAVLPAGLVRALAGVGSPDEMGLVAGVIVIAELFLGAWLARRGGKLFVAYLLLILLVSSVSSLGMHALYRA